MRRVDVGDEGVDETELVIGGDSSARQDRQKTPEPTISHERKSWKVVSCKARIERGNLVRVEILASFDQVARRRTKATQRGRGSDGLERFIRSRLVQLIQHREDEPPEVLAFVTCQGSRRPSRGVSFRVGIVPPDATAPTVRVDHAAIDAQLQEDVRQTTIASGATSSGGETPFEFDLKRALRAVYKKRGEADSWPLPYSRWADPQLRRPRASA